MQQCILETSHQGHPGIVRAKRQLRSTYWWPSMDAQIEAFVRHCLPCQDSAKSHKVTQPLPCRLETPSEPWHKVALDICGPFANAPRHQRFVIVIIDYASGIPKILLSDDITSQRLIRWLKEIFARYGNPAILLTDNGRQFISDEFEAFLHERDILHWKTAVYNPQQNGKVESFNRYLKHGIQTFNSSRKDFATGLQELLFSFRATSASPNGKSPAEIFLGRTLNLLGVLTSPNKKTPEKTLRTAARRPSRGSHLFAAPTRSTIWCVCGCHTCRKVSLLSQSQGVSRPFSVTTRTSYLTGKHGTLAD